MDEALSNVINRKVNQGQSIEQAIMGFYKTAGVEFAKTKEEALQKLSKRGERSKYHFMNKVAEFTVKENKVLIHSYTMPLVNDQCIYVINIEKLKVITQ